MQCVCEWKGTDQASQKCCRLQEFWRDPNFPSSSHQFCSTGSVWIPVKSVGKEGFHWDHWELDRGLCQVSKHWKWLCWHLVNLSPFLIRVSTLTAFAGLRSRWKLMGLLGKLMWLPFSVCRAALLPSAFFQLKWELKISFFLCFYALFPHNLLSLAFKSFSCVAPSAPS